MSSTTKTNKLGLSQFAGSDVPDWITDYSEDMLKIDEKFDEDDNSILTTLEEAEAATDPSMPVGAGVAKEINTMHNIKTYHDVSQLGITSRFIPEIIQAMPNNSYFCCDVSTGIRDVAENKMPLTLGVLTIEKVTSSRFRVMYNYSASNSIGQIYIASINIVDMTVNGWYKLAVEAV